MKISLKKTLRNLENITNDFIFVSNNQLRNKLISKK